MIIHSTTTTHFRAPGCQGWDFFCEQCGYFARYTEAEDGSSTLVILCPGDLHIRHTSGIDWVEQWQPDPFAVWAAGSAALAEFERDCRPE